MYTTLGIDSVINPRLLAAAQIVRFTRREEIVALSILQNEMAEIVELILPESAKVANKRIAEARLPRGMLIGSIVREGDLLIPDGRTKLLPGDHLVIFAIPQVSVKLERYFAPLAARGVRNHRVVDIPGTE
ncbi:MAG TPA: hypothetical protein ENN91_03825 [Firmicutes bacterium]|nr:hypothetical protein [Bacillota bacterium]